MPCSIRFLRGLTVWFLCSLFFTVRDGSAAESAKPNIVFILVDDMGYGDLGCYGAPDARTPVVDRLAKEGARFTRFYAMGPECTPSRTSILTGRYPQRAGGMECAIGTGNVGRYDDAIRLAEKGALGLPSRQAVLAPALKAAGYRNAVFGKWHMGYDSEFNPLDQGWDEFFGFLGGNVDYFTHTEHSPLHVLYEGRQPAEVSGYMTHLITDRAVDFLKRPQEKPFFLYVPYSTPHFPFQAPGDDTGTIMPEEIFTQGTRAKYVQMLEDMDRSVGRILQALEEAGRARDTLVIFASDHGAMKPGRNLPLNGWKGGLLEGGVRVPFIVRWPGHVKPGQTVEQVGTLMDLTASLLRVAQASAPEGLPLDGIDILQWAERPVQARHRTLFWRAKRGDRTWWSVLDGSDKFVRKTEGGTTEEWLFDLRQDETESRSLLEARPETVARLKARMGAWEKQVHPVR